MRARLSSRATRLGIAVCLVSGVAAFVLNSERHTDKTPTPPTEQAPAEQAPAGARQATSVAPSAWIEDVAQAERLARETGKPLLVYVSPSATCCPAAAHLDRGLCSDVNVRILGELCIPVRLRLDQPNAAADAILDKMRLRLTPALVVLSPQGEVLRHQYARLYPAFTGSGEPMPGDWGLELTLDDLRDLIEADVASKTTPAPPAPTPEQTALLARLDGAEALRSQDDRTALDEELRWLRKQLGEGPRAPEPWAPASLFRLACLEMMPERGRVKRAEQHFRLLMYTWPDSFEAQQMKHGLLDEMKHMVPPPDATPPASDKNRGSP